MCCDERPRPGRRSVGLGRTGELAPVNKDFKSGFAPPGKVDKPPLKREACVLFGG